MTAEPITEAEPLPGLDAAPANGNRTAPRRDVERESEWRQRFVEEFGGLILVYGTPRAVMRVLGWMLVSDPPEQTAQEIQEALTLSAGSVSAAVRTLGEVGMLERVARPGDRHIYYRVCAHGWERVLEGRFRAITELRRVADRALQGAGGESDWRLQEMHDTYSHMEAGVARLLRESLERGQIDTAPAGTTALRRDASSL
jgi:DNA-binding transcriptional regulator GbsR (MarR family)